MIAGVLIRHRQDRALGVHVRRAIQYLPGAATVQRTDHAHARLREATGQLALRVRFARQGEDDRLVRIAVASEQGQARNVDRAGRAEIRERLVRRTLRNQPAILERRTAVQEIGRLPDAAARDRHVDGVARRIGRIDGQRRDAGGVGGLVGRSRPHRGPGLTREAVGRILREDPERRLEAIRCRLTQARRRNLPGEGQRPV